jgi:NAD(P)-dependent dehydrogenase (short-subunit alcohol dehydrogenase family)
VFTLELLDRIKESQPSRIVILSSFFHEMAAGINYDAIYKAGETEQPYHHSHYSRYARSKLANAMFAIAVARRVKDETRLFVNYCRPGYVSTEGTQPASRGKGEEEEKVGWPLSTIHQVKDWLSVWTHKKITLPIEKGVLTQLYLATSPGIENKGIEGRYFWPVALELQPCKFLYV